MKYLLSLILFTGLSISAMAGITVPKAGDIILQNEMAVVTIRSNAIGWDGKKVLVKANVDFELENDAVEYGHFFKGGSLELQREATIAMGTLIPLMTKLVNGNFYVFSAASNEWVLHNFFKKFNKGHYIFGEKIETVARWIEAGGVAGGLTAADEEEYRLIAITATMRTQAVSLIMSKASFSYDGATKSETFTHPSGNIGYKITVIGIISFYGNTSLLSGGVVYFNANGLLHREDGEPAAVGRKVELDIVDRGTWNNANLTDTGETFYGDGYPEYWINGVQQ